MKPPQNGPILLLEFTKDLFKPLTTRLMNEGYQVECIDDPILAVKILTKKPEHYLSLILEYNGHNDKGVNVLSKIVSNSFLKTLPVILYLSSSEDNIVDAIRMGARYCLPPALNDPMVSLILEAAIADKNRYFKVQQSLKEEKAAGFLLQAHFEFKHLQEASIVANFLSFACPHPRLAIVGLSEIFINAIEHGNLGIGYQEKSRLKKTDAWEQEIDRLLSLPEHSKKVVTVLFERTEEIITIKVIDQGKGFDWKQHEKLDKERMFQTHGRGIVMAKNLVFDKITFENGGKEVICSIRLKH